MLLVIETLPFPEPKSPFVAVGIVCATLESLGCWGEHANVVAISWTRTYPAVGASLLLSLCTFVNPMGETTQWVQSPYSHMSSRRGTTWDARMAVPIVLGRLLL